MISARIGIGGTALFTFVAIWIAFHPPYEGIVLLLCAVVAAWGLWPWVYCRLPSRKKVGTYWRGTAKHHSMMAGLLLLGFGIGGLVSNGMPLFPYSTAPGPIAWDWDERARGYGYFLNMIKPVTDMQVRVLGVQLHGKNNSKDAIDDFKGYLRSDLTNEKLPIYIMAQDVDEAKIPACTPLFPTSPDQTLGIPGFANFDVSSYEKTFAVLGQDGVLVGDFLTRFVPFTVVFEYGGQKVERRFTKDEVTKQVDTFERSLSLESIPRIVRKADAPRPQLEPLHPFLQQQPMATPVPQGLLPLKPPPEASNSDSTFTGSITKSK
jgi:hypothetical protein